uniref:Uncharacterized protein n=1 Tax=Aegilops tauschii subsp. strangulata TaxID=200361 RepID=A0A453MSX3_AEGTS
MEKNYTEGHHHQMKTICEFYCRLLQMLLSTDDLKRRRSAENYHRSEVEDVQGKC